MRLELIFNCSLNLYSILILCILLFSGMSRISRNDFRQRIFHTIIYFGIITLLFDAMGRFDGMTYPIMPIFNKLGNFVLFTTTQIIPSLWFIYVYDFIHSPRKIPKPFFYTLVGINGFQSIMTVLSQFFGFFYFIDANNIYHRGPLYGISTFLTFFLLLSSWVLVIVNKNKLGHRDLIPLFFFPIPTFIGTLIQTFFYGYGFAINLLVISILSIYVFVQTRQTNTDYLTGLFNRRGLEEYLLKLQNSSLPNKPFSAIMLDLNDFKEVNDTFGHHVGDEALVRIANVLRSSLRRNDFISRYGGDEFIAVLKLADSQKLNDILKRISMRLEKHNQAYPKELTLSFGAGYAVYNPETDSSTTDFLKRLEKLMYENKRAIKEKDN